jgi:hypothetical protein
VYVIVAVNDVGDAAVESVIARASFRSIVHGPSPASVGSTFALVLSVTVAVVVVSAPDSGAEPSIQLQ